MASVTVNLTGYGVVAGAAVVWNDDVDLGTTFANSGATQTLDQTVLYYAAEFGNAAGTVQLIVPGVTPDDDFTPAFETSGRIIFAASDGEMLEVMIANADMAEPYSWRPTNFAEVIAFANHVRGLTDNNATLTLTDDPPTTTTTYEVRVKATAIGFTDSEYSNPPETIDVTA